MNNELTEKSTALKQATLTAWAKLLYEEGKIDLHHYNRIVDKIQKAS